ncbi:hypothetical protein [Bacteroides stercoris]|uniref:hypothetical protein n=1 Tax=Bacteroides stercoris TaxID=46506 RepID=UPI00189F4129|nr:hypothetical protein [Bacteroides stercoris]
MAKATFNVCLSISSFCWLFIRLPVQPLLCSLNRSAFQPLCRPFIRPFIRSGIRSYIQPGIHPIIRLPACPAVQPFDRLAVWLFSQSSVRLSGKTVSRSAIRLFPCLSGQSFHRLHGAKEYQNTGSLSV